MSLQGKVAIITGAASGIGLEIAHAYAREGAQVVIADLNEEGARSAARALEQHGQKTMVVAMDVSNEKMVDSAIEKVVSELGGIDILVSNAGIQVISRIENLDFEKWKLMMGIHLDGAFLTTRACLRQMYKQGRGGAIIYIGSVHSKEASPLKAAYVTAKHGLLGLCRTVAKEAAEHGVHANVICPGYVRTPLVEKQLPTQARELGLSEEEVISKVLLKDTVDSEFTTAAEVARAAVFLGGFETSALTGQSLIVSHGWCME
ncbi:MAG: 3-hydroxybutyrate dehydrogenase [Halioglobus sp.]|nr:3-hydroxybutyrate dehydrogenase [Halioglobus sp.]